MQSSSTVLVVEDDLVSRERLTAHLRNEGYEVVAAESLGSARKHLEKNPPCVALIDINLPDESGMNLARELSSREDIGVIMVTGRQEATDKVLALGFGADDYITKPYNATELLLRVRNLTQRIELIRKHSTINHYDSPNYRFGDCTLDTARRSLIRDSGEEVHLSRGEFEILRALVEHSGKVLSRERLMLLSGRDPANSYDRAIDSVIKRLRKKLENDPSHPRYIVTKPGTGYMFERDNVEQQQKNIH